MHGVAMDTVSHGAARRPGDFVALFFMQEK
jgi:hypothetical protein